MADDPKPPIARPVPPPPTRPTTRIPTPPVPEPHDDPTPLHVHIPDHTYFPCAFCGKLNRCPPTAIEHARALERAKPISNQVGRQKSLGDRIAANEPPGDQPRSKLVAPELEPLSPIAQDPTRILNRPDHSQWPP